jgi:hypothetical protein
MSQSAPAAEQKKADCYLKFVSGTAFLIDRSPRRPAVAGSQVPNRDATIAHDLLRISAALPRHGSLS